MTRYARRVGHKDENQDDLVSTLESRGWLVHDTTALGYGFFDFVAVKGARVVFAEVKSTNKKLSRKQKAPRPAQADVHEKFRRAGAEVVLIATEADLAQFERPL